MRIQFTFISMFVMLALLFQGCVFKDGNDMKPLKTAPFVDLSRYAGQWYEIARYPNKFQEGCVGSKATYISAKYRLNRKMEN